MSAELLRPERAAAFRGAAAVIEGPGRVSSATIDIPTPSPGEVLIRVEGCGVCASNLPVWEGREWFAYPLDAGTPGHEPWGVIESADESSGALAGERVAFLSDRGFASHAVVPVTSVVKIPDAIPTGPVPAEALACAMNIFRRSLIRPDHTVAIIGIGFLGALLTQLATSAGARVIAISRRDSSLELARRCGAHENIEMRDHRTIIERVNDLTSGQGCDVVIEATGSQWPLDLAAETTRERGRLVIAGYHQDGPRQVNLQLWNWKGLDVINAHERDPRMYVDGMRRALEAWSAGTIDPLPMLTHRFPLAELGDALDMLRRRPDGFVKAWVEMEQR